MTLALVAALVLSQGYVPQRQGTDPLADTAAEARVQRLGKQLRCAVCQGVAISDSPASMARAQLDKVRELVREGKTDQEILDYFVARYGEWVLLEPTKGGLNSVLWVGPLALLVLGTVIVILQARRKQPAVATAETGAPAPGAPETPVPPAAPAAPPAEDDFLAQVRADLEK